MIFTFAIGIVSVLLYLFLQYTRPRNFPPGPIGLPITGDIYQLGEEPYKTFQKWRKEYGDIFSVKLGHYNAIVLNTHKDIKTCLAQNVFSGRGNFTSVLDRTGGVPRGLIFNSGHSWEELSRFTVKSLRDFGFGNWSVEAIVMREVETLMDDFKKTSGEPINTGHRFSSAIINVLWSMVGGQRFTLEDHESQNLIQSVTSSMTQSQVISVRKFVPLVYIFRKAFSSFFPDLKQRRKTIQKTIDFAESAIEEHIKRFNGNNRPKDFIDCFLKQIENTTDQNSSFYKDEGLRNLTVTLMDLFVGGVETTGTALQWEIILLAMHQRKQDKLHTEIRNVIGSTSQPSLAHRELMPYTEAIIREVLRFSSLAPLGVLHSTTEDTKLHGYNIPKDTVVIVNLYGVMHDPDIWRDPEEFRPERFLSQDEQSLLKRDTSLPFSTGRRVCPGKAFAMDQLFLFTASLFQKFRVAPDPNGEPLNCSYHFASILAPKSQSIILYERN